MLTRDSKGQFTEEKTTVNIDHKGEKECTKGEPVTLKRADEGNGKYTIRTPLSRVALQMKTCCCFPSVSFDPVIDKLMRLTQGTLLL